MYKELNKIKTGFFVLDLRLSGGFHNCNLVTIASRPQMGKRDLMLNIATNIAKDFGSNRQKKNVAIFNLTISEDELNHKLHSISNEENLPIIIRNNIYNINDIIKQAHYLKSQDNISVLFIDNLQSIKANFEYEERNSNLYERFSYVSAMLKNLAMELKIPIVITSQLNKNSETKRNPSPSINDFPYSDSISYDSDIIILLHREEVILKKNEPFLDAIYNERKYKDWMHRMDRSRKAVDVTIAKYRNGETAKFSMLYNEKKSKFIDMNDWKKEDLL